MGVVPLAPFEPLSVEGESITLQTEGKILVLPTGNIDLLPGNNEYTLDPRIATFSELPLGGVKSSIPDYSVGTVNIISGDGVYLQDLSGTNSAKTLGAGKLKELWLLSFDTVAHSFTTEFQIANTGDNNPTVIDNCDATTGWTIATGSGAGDTPITTENGRIKVTGTASALGRFEISKTFGAILSGKPFVSFSIESSVGANVKFSIAKPGYTWSKDWYQSRFAIPANTNSRFVYPVLAPLGTSGMLPDSVVGSISLSDNVIIFCGVRGLTNGQAVTIYIDNITADTYKPAYIELQTPDNLAATSTQIYAHNGTAYQLCRTDSLDGAYANVSATTANCTMLDGTKFDDVYGAGLGRAVFPKGEAGQTKAGSSGNITYSANKGAKNRIGFMVQLPPSDGGRTNFNKIRLKVITYYTTNSNGKRSVTYEFSNDSSASTGLQNLIKPCLVLFDPTKSIADFYLFTHKPKNLEIRRDETGQIYEIVLHPGNGVIYHGQMTYPDLTLDSDSDYIPNVLKQKLNLAAANGEILKTADGTYLNVNMGQNGSIMQFLQSYGMII